MFSFPHSLSCGPFSQTQPQAGHFNSLKTKKQKIATLLGGKHDRLLCCFHFMAGEVEYFIMCLICPFEICNSTARLAS